MISAVVFDRDGVLTQFNTQASIAYFESLLPISMPELSDRWQQWGDRVGYPRNLAEEKTFWYGFWESLSDEFCLPQTIKTQLHRVDYSLFLQPYADAREALLNAHKRGLRVGVLSNFSLASLDSSLTAVGFGGLVNAACAAPVIGAYKPDPAAYEAIFQALGVSAEQCLFFDDEEAHVAGAQALGIQAYLVDRNQTEHNLAENIVCDLSALSYILENASLRFPMAL